MPTPHDHGIYSALLPVLVLTGILFFYCAGAVKQRRSGRAWSHWRTASFAAGILLLIFAFAPPLAQIGHHDLRAHMVQHLLIGMFAPLGLVMAAPLTLLLSSVPVSVARGLVKILHSEFITWVSHPFTALLFNIGGMYLLYLTPLYALSLTNSGLHYFIHFHFLLAGYLFIWSIAGPDPAPHRPGLPTRVAALLVGIATHAILVKFMYIYLFPFNTPHSDDEIRSAAKIMYYGGDFAELLLAIALFALWYGTHTKVRSRYAQNYYRAAR